MKKVRYLISLFFIVLMLAMGINFSSAQKVAYAASQEQIEIQYLASEVLEGQKYQYYDDSEWKDIVMPDGSYPTSAMDMISAFRNCLGSTIAYYGELYPSLAQIRVVKNGSDYLYDFVGWSAINQSGEYVVVDSFTTLNDQNITEANRENGVQTLYATFEHKKFNLTISESYANWAIDNDGNTISFTSNGDGTKTAKIPSDSVLNFVRTDETVTSAYWTIQNLETNESIYLNEQDSSVGGNYWLNYSFVMPQNDISAVYNTTIRLDTAVGDYYFGTYNINGYSSYGIKIVSGVNEHYIRWPMSSNSTTAYFTSSVPTSNQIYLDAKTYLYLDGVQLTERNTIVQDLSALYSNGIYNTSRLTNYTDDHNILIENKPANPQSYNSTRDLFEVNIYIVNNSSVFSIGQPNFINHVMNAQANFYSNAVNINLQNHELDLFAYTVVSKPTVTLQKGTINAISCGDSAMDKQIHSIHLNSNSFAMTSLKVNAADRSIFMRHSGNATSGGGNGVYFTITGSTVTGVDILHVPFLRTTSNTVIEANEIRTISYGFMITKSTITANIMAFAATVHIGYANSDSYIDSSTVTINNWFSVDRCRIRNGSKLTVTNGFYLYESLTVNNAQMIVGSLNRFRTILGNTNQDGKHYSGSLAVHYFYVDILNKAKVTITGNGVEEGKNALEIGIVHNSVPQIKVYNSTTSVEVFGNAKILNNLQVYSGASFIVHGELVLGQGLSVIDSGTIFNVEGSVYHVNNSTSDIYVSKTTDEGVTESVYWSFELDSLASINIGGNFGSFGEADRINVVFEEGINISIGGDIIRDIQVMYSLPDGYENVAANPTNIRLVNNTYSGNVVTLVKPELTGESLIELEENCWFWNNQLITGWNESGTKGTVKTYEAIYIIRLIASASNYSLLIIYDTSSIESLKYMLEGNEEWTEVEIPTSGASVSIPMGATVQVVVPAEYIGMVCAESILNNVYSTISMTNSGSTYSFEMSQMQILLYIQKELTLYLDEGDIYILDGGFARYSSTNELMVYSGNIVVSHKTPSAKCNYSLYVNRDVAESESTITFSGLNIKNNDGTSVDTIILANGVTAHIYMSGANSFRNIAVPTNSELYLHGINDAKITFADSDYYSGQTDNGAQYRAIIGDANAGKINLIGGEYTWKFSINDQGTGTAIGGVSSCKGIYLKDITFNNYNATIHARAFSAPNYTITVENSNIEFLSYTSVFYSKDLVVSGNSNIKITMASSNYSGSFVSVSNSVTLKDSATVDEVSTIKDLILTKSALTLTLEGNASYITKANLILSTLNVKDNCSLIVTEKSDTSLGRIVMAKNINISGGTITCGHLISSGYISTESQFGDLTTSYNKNTGFITGGVIEISAGVINLIGSNVVIDSDGNTNLLKGILGGSRSSTINITGGEISADVVGSCQYVFGAFRANISVIKDASFVGSTVLISGSETKLFNYSVLGGKKSNLTISSIELSVPENVEIESAIISVIDSRIYLEENAVLGGEGSSITISGTSIIDGVDGAYGTIEASNGSITISGMSSVHVLKICAENGTINISTTSRDLQGYDYYNSVNVEKVGVFVDCLGVLSTNEQPLGTMNGDIFAKNISISNNAYVCAYRIGSYNVLGSSSGSFSITDSSYLFANLYGAFGDGVCVYSQSDGAITHGNRQLAIYYNFNVSSLSELIIPEDIVYTYIYEENNPTTLTLIAPHRYGYRFDGWFDGEGNEVTSILTSQILSGEITAEWSLIDMWFYISNGYQDENGVETITYINLTYNETSLALPSVGRRYRYYFIGYLAGEDWWPALTSGLMQGTISLPSNLYDYYLSVNGIIWSDGLSDEEIAILDILEDIKTQEDVYANLSVIQFITYTAQWQTTRVDIIFDAGSIYVTTFRYNGILKQLDEQGTGVQKISMYKEEAYSVNAWCTGFIPEAVRLGYRFEYWVSDDGLFKLYTTDGDLIVNENYMTLYAVYTPLVSDNSVQVKADKHFVAFEDGLSTIDVFADSSLSITVSLNSSYDDGLTKGLQLAFSKMFINTKITLVRQIGSTVEYYYYIAKDLSKIVDLNDFVKMGYSGISLNIDVIDSVEQTLLIVVDYKDAQNVSSGGMCFDMLVFDGTNSGDLQGTTLEYNILDARKTVVNTTGQIVDNAMKGTVSIQKDSDYHYDDKQLVLVAEFENDNKNYNVDAVIRKDGVEIKGEWISYKHIVFNLGEYGIYSTEVQEYEYSISTLNLGQNVLRWKIAYSNGNNNILNNFIKSDIPEIEYDNNVLTSVLVDKVKVDGQETQDRVIGKGEHNLEISLMFKGNVAIENVDICLEKQTAYGVYETISAQISKVGNTVHVVLSESLDSGLYRIKFSYNEHSNDDDIHYTFVIN